MELSPQESAAALTLRANLARSRLAATLSALDRRRREVMNLPLQVGKHMGVLAAVAGACVVGIVIVGVYRATTAAKRRRHERWQMVRRMWTHPERAARLEETTLGKLGQTLLLGAARLVVGRLLAEARAPQAGGTGAATANRGLARTYR